MREWLGFETDEIRHQLGLSGDTVRTLLHRARMSLRECMQQRWFGGGKNATRACRARVAGRAQWRLSAPERSAARRS